MTTKFWKTLCFCLMAAVAVATSGCLGSSSGTNNGNNNTGGTTDDDSASDASDASDDSNDDESGDSSMAGLSLFPNDFRAGTSGSPVLPKP